MTEFEWNISHNTKEYPGTRVMSTVNTCTNQKLAHAFTHGWFHEGIYYSMFTSQCELANQNFAAANARKKQKQKGFFIAGIVSHSP